MSTIGMMQCCWKHDYCAPCFYLITVVTEPRRDCFGALAGESHGAATIRFSPMGEVVREVWRRSAAVYPGAEANECVPMLAPFPCHRQRQYVTRQQCLELNALAEAITRRI